MSGCNNQKLGIKLHAFELGMLPTEERQEFEEHLLKCSYCFDLVSRHEHSMRILNSDQEIQKEVVEDFQASNRPVTKSIGGSKMILGLALAAIVIVTIIFQYGSDSKLVSPTIQVVKFNKLRATNQSLIDLKKGGKARFELPSENLSSPDSLKLTLQSMDGLPIFDTLIVSSVDEQFVVFEVPIDILDTGLYNIYVRSLLENSDSSGTSYTFRAK